MPRPPVERYAPITGRRAWLAPRADGARLHAGVDLATSRDAPVVAPTDGRIVAVHRDADRTTGWRGYGPAVVVVRGDGGEHHVLAHLASDRYIPPVGTRVTEGARVGSVSSLAHVHWEVRARMMPRNGEAIVELAADPVAWLTGRVVRWDGRCPPRPGPTARTPRACRPGWRGPTDLPPWPSASPSPTSPATTEPDPEGGAPPRA